MYRRPLSTAGEDCLKMPWGRLTHNGEHGSEHEAGKAYSRSCRPVMKTAPSATAGEVSMPPPAVLPVQATVSPATFVGPTVASAVVHPVRSGPYRNMGQPVEAARAGGGPAGSAANTARQAERATGRPARRRDSHLDPTASSLELSPAGHPPAGVAASSRG